MFCGFVVSLVSPGCGNTSPAPLALWWNRAASIPDSVAKKIWLDLAMFVLCSRDLATCSIINITTPNRRNERPSVINNEIPLFLFFITLDFSVKFGG